MSQEDLSELAGVNAKYLGEVELGKTNPTIGFLVKLSWALGMDVVDLFFAAHDPGVDEAPIYAEVITLLRRLDRPDLDKLHKILKLIVEERRPV